MRTGKNLIKTLTWVICLFILSTDAHAQSTTFKTGSAIIDLGAAGSTTQNSLKPFGLIYSLLKNYNVPVNCVVNSTKVKDGIDFVYNGKSYKGGPFIVSSDFITTEVQSVLSSWAAQGVLIDYVTAGAGTLTVNVTYKLDFVPRWVMDKTNGSIAVGFLNAAGIPSSAYTFKQASQLGACDDIFVLPHADPTWNTHNNLYFWNKEQKGAIWASCHAVSVLEELSKDTVIGLVPTTVKMNFLTTNGLLSFADHNPVSTPLNHFLPGDPVAQYLSKTDNAQTGGSETVYLPKIGSAWNTGANIITTSPAQIDVPGLSAGAAAVNVYGRAFGDNARGLVCYEAAHNIGGSTTDQIAAQRIFFNFSLFAMRDKIPPIISVAISGVPGSEEVRAGTAFTVVGNVTGTGTGFTYQWKSSVPGVFSAPNAATTTFTPSTSITSATSCVITCVVTESCGRVSFDAKKLTVLPQTPPLTSADITKSIADGCATGSVTFNVFDSNTDANAGARTLVGITGLGNGTVLTTTSGDITFTASANFKGVTTGTYTITNGTANSIGNITINVGTTTVAPAISNDAATAIVNSILTIDVLANDKVNSSALAGTGAQLYIRDISKPGKGNVYISNDKKSISYLSNNLQSGTDNFTYTACNASGYCSSGTVTVTLVDNCGTGKYQSNQTTIALNASLTPTADTYMDNANTSAANGSSDPLHVRSNNGTTFYRPLITFGGLSTALSSTFVVSSASLVLTAAADYTHPASNTSASLFPLTVNPVLRNWQEATATWASASGTLSWTTGGAGTNNSDISTSASYATTFPFSANTVLTVAGGSTVTADLTNTVKAWLDGSLTNNGIRINPSVNKTSTFSFYSKENAAPSKWPKLSIDYFPCLTTPTSYLPAVYPDATTTSSALSVTVSPLSNDYNYYGNTNSLLSVTTPAHGSAVINGNQVIYTPTGDFVGTDTLTYTVQDLTNSQTNTATIRIQVSRVAPLVNVDFASTSSGSEVSINVDQNDKDQQASIVAAPVITVNPKNGTAVVNGDKTIKYTPVSGFVGKDTLIYSRTGIADDACTTAQSDTAIVFITVTNRAPISGPASISTFACAPVTVNLLSVASDPEGGALSVTITSNPANGTVTAAGAGKYTYTPNANFTGTDNFAYTVTDPLNATSLASTVSITVSGSANLNTAPLAVDDADNTLTNQVVYTNVIANDSDPNNDALSISISGGGLTAPANGTIQLMPNKLIKYTPNTNFSGTDTYQYLLTDTHPGCSGNNSLSAVATVKITVNAIATTLSGTVYNDADISGQPDFSNIKTNTESGTNASGQLYVYAVGSNNIVKDVTPVNSDGTYLLSNVPSLTSGLKLVLSSEVINVGGTFVAAILPTGYVNSSPLTRALPTTTSADMGGYDWGVYTSATLSPGAILAPGNLCGPGIPAAIVPTSNATGGSLTATRYKYQWEVSTTSASSGFANISAADTLTSYTPTAPISVTTYYRRGVVTKDLSNNNVNSIVYTNVATVLVQTIPTLTINPTSTTIASGISATLSGTSTGDTFGWSPAATLSSSTTASVTATPLTSTVYTLTASFAATGCSLSATSTVLVLNPGTIGSNQNNCGSFTPATITSVADASGLSITGITYKWQSSTTSASSGFADITGATANTYSPGVTAVTTYFRRVATKDDASATSNVVTVTVNAKPTLTINPTSTTIASGISATLSGTSTGDTFGWSPAATLSSSTTASVTATPLTSTVYTLTASFAATGCSLSATSTVLVLNPGTIGSNQNNCGSFTPATITSVADASGLSITGITYKWQSSTTSSSSGFSDIAGATASSYTPGTTAVTTYFRRIAIKDDASATSNVVTVTINTVPTVAATNNSPICAGGVLSLSSSGGTSYSWTGPNSVSSTSQNPSINSATTAASGTYSVVVTAANGCTASISTTATVNALPAVTVSPSSASVNLGNSVPLVASGASNYTWSPSTGLSAANIASVTANPTVTTTYSVTGTAASSGCTNTTTVTVTVLPSLVLVPGTIGVDQTICSGATPATLTSITNASGGTGSISYQWQQSTDNSTFTDIGGATAVSYAPAPLMQNTFYRRGAKTSTDAVIFSNTVKVTVQLSVSGTISGGGISVCGGTNSGSLSLTGNTGSVVKWQSSTNGFTTATDISNTTGSLSFSNLAATTQYRAIVQQSTCAVATSAAVTVTVNPLPVTGAIAGPCALTRDSSGIFTTSAVANATRYVWALPTGWSGTSLTNTITVKAGAAAGTISVTAFNGACASLTTSSYKVTIIDYAQVTITATPVVASGNLSSTMLVKIQLFDVEGKPVNCSGGIATLCSNIPSAVFSTVADNNDGTYSSFLSSPANNIKICGTVGGIPLSKTTNVTFTGPQGGIKGNGPILETEIPKLTFTFTSGVGPFTVIYRSAKSTKNDTLTNVVSGKAIPVASIPSTTLYTLLSIIDNGTGERRNDNFNRDTATIIVVGPRIIVTLHADPAKYERDSLWSTRLTLHVKNIGELDLNNVQVKLNLKDVFPSPVTYVLDSVVVNGTTVVKNSSYDGVQNSDLFARLNKPAPAWQATSPYIVTAQASPGVDGEDGSAPASSNVDHEASADADEHSVYMFGALSQLPVGVEGTMFLYIHLKPNGYYEPFVMQAVALGTGHTEEGAALATSLSNDNNDVNSHPELTKKGDPLPTVVNLIPNPVVGVSLAAGTPVDKGNGTYDVTLSYSVRNYGNVNLQSLRIFQNLSRMIGAPSTFTIVAAVSTTGTLVPNPAFDGNLDSNLLLTTSELQFAQAGTIQYTINIKPNQLSALYRLQAMASAFNTDISGTVTDLSTDGSNPDPDGDKIPSEKVLTLIVINMPIPPLVPGNIGIDTLPPLRLTTLTKTYCNSASGVVVVSTSGTTGGSGPYEWQWQSSVDNSTFINIAGATDSILTNANFTTSTYLRRRVISDNQVAYTNSVYVQISTVAKPVVSPSGPLTLPFNGTVTLTSSAAPIYNWSTGAATQNITTGLPGSFAVTVKNSAGCSATSDPVAVKPPPPKTLDSTYIVGALSNPANSGVQVTAMNGATLNYYLVAANGTLVAVPALPALTGDFVYYVSETLNGVESDRVQYKVKMLDLPADIEKLLTKAPTLQADGGFLMSFNFRATNKRNELLDSVRIKDDLSKVFPSGSSWEIASLQATGKLIANSQFNGSTQTDLLAAGSQLPGLQKDSVQLSLKVYPKGFSGTLNNSAELTAKSPYGVFRVISNDPTVGNGIAVRNPTKFFIPLVDIFIPSGFSPNHDGMNDVFVISHPFNMEINLEVYNRWGNLVFKSPDYKNEFDGRGNQPNNILGAELPDGTYYYIVLATDKTTNSVKKFAGFITLKR